MYELDTWNDHPEQPLGMMMTTLQDSVQAGEGGGGGGGGGTRQHCVSGGWPDQPALL